MTPLPDPSPILRSQQTLSAKIRALAAVGYARADIARLVDRSYQHVRQVLVDEERRQARTSTKEPVRAMREEAAPFTAPTLPAQSTVERLVVEEGGCLTLPHALLAALAAGPGTVIMAEIAGDGVVTLRNRRASMLRAQEILRPYAGDGRAAEELIAERRSEAARENDDG